MNIQNNYEGSNVGAGSANLNQYCNISPLEKYIEAVDKIEKLYAELLKAKEEQIRLLEKMVNN